MPKWVMLLISAIILGVVGQLLFKEGISKVDVAFKGLGGAAGLVWRLFTNPVIFLGLISYGISTVFWILVLKEKDLSLVYPMLASSYILILLTSWIFRHEAVSPFRWLGALVITLGVILISRG